MMVQQLAAQVALPGRIAKIRAVKGGEVVAPVDARALHGIRQPFGVEDELVQLKTIRVDIVRFRSITMRGGAEVQSRIEPSIDLRPAAGLVDGGHERIAICVRLTHHRRTAIRPIGIGKWRRIERRRKAAARWGRGRRGSNRRRPVLTVKLRPAGKEALRLGGIRRRSVGQRRGLSVWPLRLRKTAR